MSTMEAQNITTLCVTDSRRFSFLIRAEYILALQISLETPSVVGGGEGGVLITSSYDGQALLIQEAQVYCQEFGATLPLYSYCCTYCTIPKRIVYKHLVVQRTRRRGRGSATSCLFSHVSKSSLSLYCQINSTVKDQSLIDKCICSSSYQFGKLFLPILILMAG